MTISLKCVTKALKTFREIEYLIWNRLRSGVCFRILKNKTEKDKKDNKLQGILRCL